MYIHSPVKIKISHCQSASLHPCAGCGAGAASHAVVSSPPCAAIARYPAAPESCWRAGALASPRLPSPATHSASKIQSPYSLEAKAPSANCLDLAHSRSTHGPAEHQYQNSNRCVCMGRHGLSRPYVTARPCTLSGPARLGSEGETHQGHGVGTETQTW
jgi:hypothetical protein